MGDQGGVDETDDVAETGTGEAVGPLDATLDFHIVVPPGWWELPILAPDLPAAVTAVVDERLALAPRAVPNRELVIGALVNAAREAQAAGAIYAAQIGASSDSFDFALALIVAIRELPLPTLGHEARDIEWLITLLAHQRDGATTGTVEGVTLGRLGAGVREHLTRHGGGSPGGSVTYWFPVRGTARLAVIKITSPTTADMTEVIPLLDQIVSTVVITPGARRPHEA
jgi:hypothetical protein